MRWREVRLEIVGNDNSHPVDTIDPLEIRHLHDPHVIVDSHFGLPRVALKGRIARSQAMPDSFWLPIRGLKAHGPSPAKNEE